MEEISYDDLLRSRRRGEKSKSIARPMLVLLLLILSAFFLIFFKNQKPTDALIRPDAADLSSPLERQPIPLVKIKPQDRNVVQEKVLAEVKQILDEAVGTFGLYVYDFNREEGYGINEHIIFDAASVTKVPILVSLYSLIQDGKINDTTNITLQDEDIQDYGSGQLRYEGAGKTYTVKTLARLMMEKSDNTAAYILATQIIGTKKIVEYIKTWGLEQTDFEKNVTSSYDMGMLFKKLHGEEIIKNPYLKEMFDFMKDTDYEDRIPALLPKAVPVYHKTGDQVSVSHDAGIVDLTQAPYYIGIFTSNMLIDEPQVKAAIARAAKRIFDYQSSL